MRHLVIIKGRKTELYAKFNGRLNGFTIKFILSFLLPCSGISQVNPWESQKTGANPWGQQEKVKEVTPEKVQPEIIENRKVLEVPEDQIVTDAPERVVPSTSSKTFFLEGDTIDFSGIEDDALMHKYLEDYAYEKQNSTGYFAAGMVGGFFFNIFASPVLPAIGLPESATGRRTSSDFEKSNPLASKEARKAIKKGSRKKRVKKVFLGTLAGAAAQIALFFTLIAF